MIKTGTAIFALVLFFSSVSFAGEERFCQWNEETGESFGCVSVKKYNNQYTIPLLDGSTTHFVSVANEAGLYRLRFIDPIIEDGYKRGDKIFYKPSNEIIMTYEVEETP